MTRLVLLADTHGFHRGLAVPDGDVLVHAGDLTCTGALDELEDANRWLAGLPHRHKLAIAGNHDFCLQNQPRQARATLTAARYLEDEEVTVAGLRFWGSPWQPRFHDWAFNLPRGAPLSRHWARVPEGLDVLLTHTPPARVLDSVDGRSVGCQDLLDRVREVRPRLAVFGHIHEARGALWQDGVLFVNAATGEGRHPAMVLDWPPREPELPR